METSSSPTGAVRLSALIETGIVRYDLPFGLFIIAASGMGKHFHACSVVWDRLAAGKAVVILDCGRSYRKAVELLGGAHVELAIDGSHSVRTYGTVPLVVYEFEEMCGSPWTWSLPTVEGRGDPADGGMVLIDETWMMAKCLPALPAVLREWVEAGASFCITGQSDDDVAAFRDLPLKNSILRLSRN